MSLRRKLLVLLTVVLPVTGHLVAAPLGAAADPAVPNFSPTSRTVRPTAIFRTTGSVSNPQNVLTNQATRLSGTGSSLTLDFGKEVGGVATLSFGATSDSGQQVGLAFTESSLYVGTGSDKSAGYDTPPDGALTASAASGGSYTMPTARLRGGFRYLTVFMRTGGWIDLTGVSLAFTPAPGKANPADYANYFSSNDDLLNRIWYAGAYTVQTNTIASNQGRAWPPPSSLWDNSAVVGVGDSVLVDGAKRDRTVWPGDLGIAVPTAYASTNDMVASRNALTTMFSVQSSAGEIPWSGPVFNLTGSDTYHTWTLLMSSTYYGYTGDRTWLDSVWPKFKLGMSFIIGKIDGNGLLNVTATQDWARQGMGGENIEANAILYAALAGASRLATIKGETALAAGYSSRAATLKAAVNARLWVPSAGMYRDNPTSDLYPQDGNALAVWYGLTDSESKSSSIARKLAARWGPFGGITPEWDVRGAHPFTGSMEVNAHFTANDDHTGLAQIRRTWGYMLDSPIGTKSTFWEGIDPQGGFPYGGAFMSLAHGWSTGPTSALTFYVLGLSPEPDPGRYRFVPHPGDLTSVEGRITMPQGSVGASWSRHPSNGTYTARLTSPGGTVGRIGVPKLGGTALTITVNGSVVWNNGTFLGGTGIGGATQDARYVYLDQVAPGAYDISATGLGNPPPPPTADGDLPPGFTRCAGEGEQCAFSGNRVVAYGAGAYTYKIAGSGTACTSAAFGGDPASGVLKSCYVAPMGGPTGYTQCAEEGQTCSFTGYGRTIAYGANGAYYTKVASGPTPCTNAVFGDPIDRLGKACHVAPAGPPPGGWTQCAAENGTCAAVNGQPVAYGAFGSFVHKTVTGPVTCDNPTFGEAVPGEVKACYVKTGGPNGFSTACAVEGNNCAFTGTRTVAMGARGSYLFRTFTGGTPCTTAAFGSDPLPGVQKSCYLTP